MLDAGRVVKPYYEDRFVALYLGDCLEVMADLDVGYEGVGLVFTSPPYNLGGASNDRLRSTSRNRDNVRWGGNTLRNGYGSHADDLPWPEYVAWQRRVLSACWDLLGDEGAIFYNHKPVIRDKELRLPLECNPGLPIRQIITWDRGSGFNFSRTHYLPVTEWVVVFARPAFALRDTAASKVTDLWRFDFEQHTDHPAPFPIELPLRAMATTDDTTVLDPFAGSGTTLLAAKLQGRRAIGIELEERFCEMAALRLSQETLPLFGISA